MQTTTLKKTGRPRIFTDGERKLRRKEYLRKLYEKMKQNPEWLERRREQRRRVAAKRRKEKHEHILEINRKSYNRHHAQRLEWQRQYRLRNRETIAEKRRQWRREHPEEYKEKQRMYAANKRAKNKAERLVQQAQQLQAETQRKVDEFNKLFENWI